MFNNHGRNRLPGGLFTGCTRAAAICNHPGHALRDPGTRYGDSHSEACFSVLHQHDHSPDSDNPCLPKRYPTNAQQDAYRNPDCHPHR